MAEELEKTFFIKDTAKKFESTKKMTLIELKEVLAREAALLKNKYLMKKLPDKGNSIKTFHDQVEKEIKHKEELADIEVSLKSLDISDTDKHIQKVCELETSPKKDRYKPFSTLNKTQELHTNRKVYTTMEDWSKCNRPTKLITLKDSLEMLKEQDKKVKLEQTKMKHRLLVQLNEEDSDSSSSEDNCELN